jgi:uncharacterized protein
MSMRCLRWIIASCYGFVLLVVCATAVSAQISIAGSGLRAAAPARSMKELRDANVVKQRYDFSCGAAALATLTRYGLGENLTERQILVELFNLLSDDERMTVSRTGFSLLHLQRVAKARGYGAEGFRLDPEQLPLLNGPVLVYIEPHGYKHFAVLRGVRNDRVYLADPSRGNIRMAAHTFLKTWLQADGKGIIFAVDAANGSSPGKSLLDVAEGEPSLPEIMTARELLAVGNPLLRPQLLR